MDKKKYLKCNLLANKGEEHVNCCDCSYSEQCESYQASYDYIYTHLNMLNIFQLWEMIERLSLNFNLISLKIVENEKNPLPEFANVIQVLLEKMHFLEIQAKSTLLKHYKEFYKPNQSKDVEVKENGKKESGG